MNIIALVGGRYRAIGIRNLLGASNRHHVAIFNRIVDEYSWRFAIGVVVGFGGLALLGFCLAFTGS